MQPKYKDKMDNRSFLEFEGHTLENIQVCRLQLINNNPQSNHPSQPNKNTKDNTSIQYQFAGHDKSITNV